MQWERFDNKCRMEHVRGVYLPCRYMKGVLLAGGELSAAEEGGSGVQMVSPLLPKLKGVADAQAGLHTTGCPESELAYAIHILLHNEAC